LERAKAKVRKRKGELATAEAEVAELEAQISALASLSAGGAPREAEPGTLRGRAIREVAVGLLLRRGPNTGPIHYRAWLLLLEEAGHTVAGRRPDAVFLNQVTRHPLVRSTTRAGFYELDLSATARLDSRVTELRTSLAVELAQAPSEQGGSHAVALDLSRAERVLAEARAALAAKAR